jgi:hypothetical protein
VIETIRGCSEIIIRYVDKRLAVLTHSPISSADDSDSLYTLDEMLRMKEDVQHDFASLDFVEYLAFIADNLVRWTQKIDTRPDCSRSAYTISNSPLYPSTTRMCAKMFSKFGASAYRKAFLTLYPLASVSTMRSLQSSHRKHDGIKYSSIRQCMADIDALHLALWKQSPGLDYRKDFKYLRVTMLVFDETKGRKRLDANFIKGDATGFVTDMQLFEVHSVSTASTGVKALEVVTAASRSAYIAVFPFTGMKSIVASFSGNGIKGSTIYAEVTASELAQGIVGMDFRITMSDNAAPNTVVTNKLCTERSFFLFENERQTIDPVTPVGFRSLIYPNRMVWGLRCPPHWGKTVWHNDAQSTPDGSKKLMKWNFRLHKLVPYDFDAAFQSYKDYTDHEGNGKIMMRGQNRAMFEDALNPMRKMSVPSMASYHSNSHNLHMGDEMAFLERGRISDVTVAWTRVAGKDGATSATWIRPQAPTTAQQLDPPTAESFVMPDNDRVLYEALEAQRSWSAVIDQWWDVVNSKDKGVNSQIKAGGHKTFRRPIYYTDKLELAALRQVTRSTMGTVLAIEKLSHSLVDGGDYRLSLARNAMSHQTIKCSNLVGNGMAGAIEQLTYEFQKPLWANLLSGDSAENLFGFIKELYPVSPTMEEIKIGESKYECYQHARRQVVVARIVAETRAAARELEGRERALPLSRFATYSATKAARPHNRRTTQYHKAVSDGVEGTLKGNCSLGCADITPEEFVTNNTTTPHTKLMKQRNCATSSLDHAKALSNENPLSASFYNSHAA